jgi:hypothetical protein
MRLVPRSGLALAAAAALLTWVGCHTSGETLTLDATASGRSPAVPVGQEFSVTLQTVGPGAYGNPVLTSEAVRFLGASVIGQPNPAGPTRACRFGAVARGRATVTIPHEGRSADMPAVVPFSLSVDVY